MIRTIRTYTHHGGYVLGRRCHRQHGGSQRYHLVARGSIWAQCQGCGHFADAESLGFGSRAAALRAELTQ